MALRKRLRPNRHGSRPRTRRCRAFSRAIQNCKIPLADLKIEYSIYYITPPTGGVKDDLFKISVSIKPECGPKSDAEVGYYIKQEFLIVFLNGLHRERKAWLRLIEILKKSSVFCLLFCAQKSRYIEFCSSITIGSF